MPQPFRARRVLSWCSLTIHQLINLLRNLRAWGIRRISGIRRIRLVHSGHGGAGIWRTTARTTIIEHHITEQLNVLSLNFHRHRTRRDELRRSLAVGGDQAAASPLAGDVPDA